MNPKPQLHVTGLTMLSNCGEAFRRRYIEGEIIPPGVAAVRGKAVDASVTANLANKIETGELLSLEAVTDLARDSANGEWMSGVKLTEDEVAEGAEKVKGETIDASVRLAALHSDVLAPVIEPTHVQRAFSIAIPGYPFDIAGTFDIQEGAVSIRDTKTKKVSPVKTLADQSIQLTTYALAMKALDGEMPEKVALDVLVDLKTPKAVTLESTRSKADLDALAARLEAAAKVIEAGLFTPASPDSWQCDPRYCGYYSTCRYVK